MLESDLLHIKKHKIKLNHINLVDKIEYIWSEYFEANKGAERNQSFMLGFELETLNMMNQS